MSYDKEQYKADIAAKRWCQFVPKHERPVLSKLIKLGLEGGNVASIYDSEDWVVNLSTDQALLRSQLGHTDEDVIHFFKAGGDHLGYFYLIYNNGSDGDPMIVISDYSSNEFCNAIWNRLNEKYGE